MSKKWMTFHILDYVIVDDSWDKILFDAADEMKVKRKWMRSL
jgi:hypothetical protein